MKKIKLLSLLVVPAMFVAGVTGVSNATESKADDPEYLAFTDDNWVVRSGNTALSGTNTLAVTTADTADNPTIIESKVGYENYHLQYRAKWEWGANHNNQIWTGLAGVILNESWNTDTNKMDGFYFANYEWGGRYHSAFGYYRNGIFDATNSNYGVDNGWGFDQIPDHNYRIDVWVQNDFYIIQHEGWMFACGRIEDLPGRKIAIYNVQNQVTYSDFIIEPITEENYDIYSRAERANWIGFNMIGTEYYFNSVDNHHEFSMKMPSSKENVVKYYLARDLKLSDPNQNVDVYLDKTNTKGLNDEWDVKVGEWEGQPVSGTRTQPNGDYGVSLLELDASAFADVAADSTVKFLLKKTVEGWYSARSYWFIYETSDGKKYIADYFDVCYNYDRINHGFETVKGNEGNSGVYGFFNHDAVVIMNFKRGEEVQFWKNPEINVAENAKITHEFGVDESETSYTVENISEFFSVVKNHKNYIIKYKVGEGEETDSVVLPRDTKTGVITVILKGDPSMVNDGSGAPTFNDVSATIPYSTTVAQPVTYTLIINDGTTELENVAVADGVSIDLSDYVPTDRDGATFIGFTDGVNSYGKEETIVVHSNLTLTTVWEPVVPTSEETSEEPVPTSETPVSEAPVSEAPVSEAPVSEAAPSETPTTSEEKKGGCGGSIAATCGIISLLAITGVGIALRKKEN